MQQKVNCKKCQYYFVTWEQHQPHGCKAYGFKTKMVPSVVVKNSSKMECTLFVQKHRS